MPLPRESGQNIGWELHRSCLSALPHIDPSYSRIKAEQGQAGKHERSALWSQVQVSLGWDAVRAGTRQVNLSLEGGLPDHRGWAGTTQWPPQAFRPALALAGSDSTVPPAPSAGSPWDTTVLHDRPKICLPSIGHGPEEFLLIAASKLMERQSHAPTDASHRILVPWWHDEPVGTPGTPMCAIMPCLHEWHLQWVAVPCHVVCSPLERLATMLPSFSLWHCMSLVTLAVTLAAGTLGSWEGWGQAPVPFVMLPGAWPVHWGGNITGGGWPGTMSMLWCPLKGPTETSAVWVPG